MIDPLPKGWKNHFITTNHHVNPGSVKVWFKSACKLISSGAPTEFSTLEKKPITCLRCINALKKEGINDNSKKG